MTLRESIAAARLREPERLTADAAAMEFRFAANDPVFAGHFPTNPLLPGVFQIEMARAAAEWCLSRAFAVREISKAKFQHPILPEQTVRLELKWSEAEGSLRLHALFSVAGQRAGETTLVLCQ